MKSWWIVQFRNPTKIILHSPKKLPCQVVADAIQMFSPTVPRPNQLQSNKKAWHHRQHIFHAARLAAMLAPFVCVYRFLFSSHFFSFSYLILSRWFTIKKAVNMGIVDESFACSLHFFVCLSIHDDIVSRHLWIMKSEELPPVESAVIDSDNRGSIYCEAEASWFADHVQCQESNKSPRYKSRAKKLNDDKC